MTSELSTSDQPEKRENGSEGRNDPESIIPDEILNAIPKEDRGEFMRSITQISGVFPQQHPLLKKITSDHITSIINNSNEEDRRDREERKSERSHNYKLFVTSIIGVILVCLLFILTEQLDFLKYVIGAILGFAGGFGVGKFKRDND